MFEHALKERRPVFVDYFLRRNHNPFQTTEFLECSKKVGTTVRSGDESDSSRNTRPAAKDAMKSEMDIKNDMQVECALKFILEELYQSDRKHFDVRLFPFRVFSHHVYMLFL